ncbi:MAG: methyltransferase domain-containing protein [Intrasporangium sp.]|uniref:class I SAM-dependent methyltransferase n=1 Tax=Intrasporangium sp. TaxID=1925024 RepID=UPI002649F1F8|nr:class I SAM-dependent methyltransferase [Intrasporangium sp.]MDN5796522.1 methyltransferase domain-containing protein [Intrasporangium sp.]
MTFDVAGDAYGRYMGRYSEPLAARLVDWLAPPAQASALDVGCGPGALTAVLVGRFGIERVHAVDPSPTFRTALGQRLPGVDVREARAGELPWAAGTFDLALASLVVHFMPDPVAGLREMRRVTRPGGTVAVTVWDLAGHRAPMSLLRHAALELDPGAPGEEGLPGARRHELAGLLEQAGLQGLSEAELEVTVAYQSFDEWWEPYTLGVGPTGDYVCGLAPDRQDALRDLCRARAGEPPFEIRATAWAARGRA